MTQLNSEPSGAVAFEQTCPYPAGRPWDPDNVGPAATPGWLPVARRDTPMLWMPEFRTWLVTRHEDVKKVAMDHRTFSSSSVNRFKVFASECLRDAFPGGHPGEHSMLKMDPPHHTRVRRLADVAFTRKAADGYTAMIREIADDLIDKVVDRGEMDLVAHFATKFPLQVILGVTGIPLELDDEFAQWGVDYFALIEGFPDLTPEQEQALAARGKRVREWMYDFVQRRRAEPTNDLVSHLVLAQDDQGDAQLTDDEIVGVINSNLVAGVETTATLVPQMMDSLLSDRSQWEALLADRSLVPNAAEEALRFWSPGRGVRRRVRHDVELGGVQLREGDEVFAAFIAGNHDDEVFEDSATFDVRRDGLRNHLAFGKGTHLCIGAQVARKELQIVLECFLDRLPDLTLVDGRQSLRGAHLMTMARHDFLRVAWTPPTVAVTE